MPGDRANSQKWWFSLSDYLKHEMPNAVIASVKLKRRGVGKKGSIVKSNTAPLTARKKSGHPHPDVKRNFKGLSKSVSDLTREKTSRIATLHVINNNGRLKGKKRNRIGP
jgi:hypothetical protein